MTFPGVAVFLDEANPVVGTRPESRFPIAFRSGGDPITFEAGDEFLCGFYSYYPAEFADAGTVEAFFVVEHLSGSATLRLSAGWDPTYDATDPVYASTSLGDVAVSGDGVTSVAVPLFDLAQFLANTDELVILVEVLSGSIEVRQIRLRVWPVGGPVGAWVTMPGFDHEYGTAIRDLVLTPTEHFGDEEAGDAGAAYDAAAAELVGTDQSRTVTSVHLGAQTFEVFLAAQITTSIKTLTPLTYDGAWQVVRSAVRAIVDAATVAFYAYQDAAIVRPPDVVNDADEAWVIASGSPSLSGMRVIGTVSNEAAHNGPDSFLTSRVTTAASIVGSTYPETFAASAPPGAFDVTFPLSGSGDGIAVLFGFGNPFLSGPDPWSGVLGDTQGPFNALAFTAGTVYPTLSLPPFQAWDPDAVPEDIPMRLRQRGDGLGMGAPRVRGTASRQASLRVRGHY